MNKAMDIFGTVASLGGVAVANKALTVVWKQVTGCLLYTSDAADDCCRV